MHKRQQAAGSRQQAAGSRQQAAGSRQQAAGSRQQAAGSTTEGFRLEKMIINCILLSAVCLLPAQFYWSAPCILVSFCFMNEEV